MSYRIVIADDEPKIIQLIRQLGHWEEFGIEIIAECSDGEQAFRCILEKQPDFVLSDIKMPVFDGIELIQKTREHGMDTLFVLLSGYRHFEYARSAIQLNVMDYLLKPIDEKQLNETLDKVCRQVDQLRTQKESHLRLSRFESQKGKEQLADLFWLLTDRQPDNVREFEKMTLQQCNATYHTQFGRECYQVLCTVSNLSGMLEQKDSLFSEKVTGFIQNCFKDLAVAYYYATFQGHIILLNFNEKDKNEIKKAVSVLYYNIQDLSEAYGNFRLNIGCSSIKYSNRELIKAFLEANATEWGRLIFLGNSIIEYRQLEKLPCFTLADLMTPEEESRLMESLKYLREEELGDLFAEVYKRSGKFNNANPESMNLVFWGLYSKIINSISIKTEQDRFHERYYYAYLEGKNFQQVMKNLYEVLEKYMLEEKQKLKEKLGKPLGEAVKFIKKNYMNQISAEDAAEAGNISTTYLSRLFKSEMKIGFNEYLTKIRMEESQKLLSETNHSIREIAGMVGYTDEKYYSRLFKKSTGIKPTEYRRLYG